MSIRATLSQVGFTVCIFCTLYFCLEFLYGFLGWYVPYLLILYTGSVIGGVVLTIAHFCDAIVAAIGGVLSDIIGRRIVAITGTLLYIVAGLLLVIGTASGNYLLLALSVIITELTAIKSPAIGALLADNIPREVIGRVSSICSLVGMVGSAIGASLLVYVFKLSTELFLAALVGLGLPPMIAVLVLREQRPEGVNVSLLNRIRDTLRSGIEFWKTNRKLAYFTIVNAAGHGLAGEYLAPYLTQIKHIADVHIGVCNAVITLGQGAVRYLVGHLLDKNIKLAIPLIRLGTLLAGVLWLALIYSPSLVALVLYVISGVVTPLVTASIVIYLLKTSNPEARGTILGSFQSILNTTYTLAITPGGLLYQIDKSLVIIVAALILTLAPLKP